VQLSQWQRISDSTLFWEATQAEAVSALPVQDKDLREFLVTVPTKRARIAAHMFDQCLTQVSEFDLNFYFERVSEGEVCDELGRQIVALICCPAFIPGSNEDSFHGRIDQCVLSFLKRFIALQFGRNTSLNASSTLLVRPDVVASVPGKGCYFRGEENRFGSNENPKKELFSKLHDVWPFPGIPYVLGYYANGTIVRFAKIVTDGTFDISTSLDLDKARDRLICWNITRNIARLLNFMVNQESTSIPYDMIDLERGTGVDLDCKRFIRFSGGHVVKEFEMNTDALRGKQDRLQEVISIVKGTAGVQPIVSQKLSGAKRQRGEKLYIQTTLGQSIPRVKNQTHLRDLVNFLVRTVRILHDKGVTHRDIRLANIVQSIVSIDAGVGEFGLIDWDDSVKGIVNLDNAEVAHLDKNSHAPEMFVEGGTHDCGVDLWSIGHLIQQNKEHADDTLVGLMEGLLKPPLERLSDSTACETLGIPVSTS
jgi:serine/threonine protein kinase